MYCCDGFKCLVENAGQKGFSIVVCEWDGVIHFWLQARSGFTDQQLHEFWQALQARKIDSIRYLSLAEGQYVKYCPYCGKKPLNLLKKYPKEYRVLLAKHKVYVDETGSIKSPTAVE